MFKIVACSLMLNGAPSFFSDHLGFHAEQTIFPKHACTSEFATTVYSQEAVCAKYGCTFPIIPDEARRP